MYKIFHKIGAGVLPFVAAMVLATPTFASNPHFISSSASLGSGDSLIVQFKEAGLGNNQDIHYVASADATAEYACINNGGKHPKATNKESVSGPVSSEDTFNSGQNGQINQTLTIHAPSAGDFSCPPGQTLVLASVSYTNVRITDTTNNVSESISGTFSRTFFSF